MKSTHRATRARSVGALAGTLVTATLAVLGLGATALPASASAMSPLGTTTDLSQGSNQCLNGPAGVDPINCNHYAEKTDVWLSGLPNDLSTNADGTYFFAVLSPGGQPDPDGAVLSSDSLAQRTFTVTNGQASMVDPSSTHAVDTVENKIQIAPFDDTANNGGVYIAAICQLDAGVIGECKYDVFKVGADSTPMPVSLSPLTVSKDGSGAYTDTHTWQITKSLDATQTVPVDRTKTPPTAGANSGSIPIKYDVVASESDAVSAVSVTGLVTVNNPNPVPVDATVTENGLSDGTACTFDADGAATTTATMAPGDNTFAYTCTYPADTAAVPSGVTNAAAVTWGFQTSVSGDGETVYVLDPPDAPVTAGAAIAFTGTELGRCTTLSDTAYPALNGTRVCAGDADKSVAYTIVWPVPSAGCVNHTNTASFVTDDTGATGTSSATVRICRTPLVTGARTIGFWKNKNGQRIITGQAKSGVCPSTAWLRGYAPFKDLGSTATCAAVGKYVNGVLSAATAKGPSMNAMLKAQMLATALDVYFSNGSLGGNKLGAPSPIGGRVIDLTSPFNASPAFNGHTQDTVAALLTIAASHSNAGGTAWYGQVKATQGLAKDTFDNINNEVAYGF